MIYSLQILSQGSFTAHLLMIFINRLFFWSFLCVILMENIHLLIVGVVLEGHPTPTITRTARLRLRKRTRLLLLLPNAHRLPILMRSLNAQSSLLLCSFFWDYRQIFWYKSIDIITLMKPSLRIKWRKLCAIRVSGWVEILRVQLKLWSFSFLLHARHMAWINLRRFQTFQLFQLALPIFDYCDNSIIWISIKSELHGCQCPDYMADYTTDTNQKHPMKRKYDLYIFKIILNFTLQKSFRPNWKVAAIKIIVVYKVFQNYDWDDMEQNHARYYDSFQVARDPWLAR